MWILWTLLAVFSWALLSVIDSLLVRHFEQRILVISWAQSMMSVPMILCLGFFFPIQNDWALFLFVMGSVSYIGDMIFWRILKIADVSSTNFVGVFITIIMTLTGILFFHESLLPLQIVGAVIVLIGVAYLSIADRLSLSREALLLMVLAALVFSPFYIVQKWMLDHGQLFFSTFFWMILGREMSAISLTSFLPTSRRQSLESVSRQPFIFFVCNFVSISLFLFAMYSMSRAYNVGQASFVSILGNIQPFIAIALAWILSILVPRHAPREILTAISLRAKIISFSLVFLGLALLAFSQ